MDKLIALTNNEGRYQIFAEIFVLLLWFNCNFMTNSLAFLEDTPLVLHYDNKTNQNITENLNYDLCKENNYTIIETYNYSWVIEHKIECDATKIGLIGTFMFIGETIGAVVSSPLADHFGAKYFLSFSAFIFALEDILCIFFDTYYFKLAYALINGITDNFLCYPSIVLTEEIVSSRLRSIYGALTNIGFSLGGIVFSLIFYALGDWKIVLMVNAGFILLVGLVVLFCFYDSPRVKFHQDFEKAIEILRGIAKFNGKLEEFDKKIEEPEYKEMLDFIWNKLNELHLKQKNIDVPDKEPLIDPEDKEEDNKIRISNKENNDTNKNTIDNEKDNKINTNNDNKENDNKDKNNIDNDKNNIINNNDNKDEKDEKVENTENKENEGNNQNEDNKNIENKEQSENKEITENEEKNKIDTSKENNIEKKDNESIPIKETSKPNNNNENNNSILSDLKELSSSFNENTKNINTCFLLCHKSILIKLILSSLIWFICSAFFDGLIIGVKGLPGSITFNAILMHSLEIISYIVCGIMMDTKIFGRKRTSIITFLLSFVLFIALAIFIENDIAAIALYVSIQFIVTIPYTLMSTYCIEIYPSQIRTLAYGINGAFANIGGVVVPMVLELLNTKLVYVIFSVLSGICAFIFVFLEETVDRPMVETIEELENKKKRKKRKKN